MDKYWDRLSSPVVSKEVQHKYNREREFQKEATNLAVSVAEIIPLIPEDNTSMKLYAKFFLEELDKVSQARFTTFDKNLTGENDGQG